MSFTILDIKPLPLRRVVIVLLFIPGLAFFMLAGAVCASCQFIRQVGKLLRNDVPELGKTYTLDHPEVPSMHTRVSERYRGQFPGSAFYNLGAKERGEREEV